MVQARERFFAELPFQSIDRGQAALEPRVEVRVHHLAGQLGQELLVGRRVDRFAQRFVGQYGLRFTRDLQLSDEADEEPLAEQLDRAAADYVARAGDLARGFESAADVDRVTEDRVIARVGRAGV